MNSSVGIGPLGNALVAIALLASGVAAHAVGTDTWSGSTVTWSTTANWTTVGGSTPPATGDSLVFAAAGAGGLTLTDDLMTPASYTVARITFTSAAGAYVINPNTIGTNGFTLSTAITNNCTHLQTINDLIALSGTDTFTMTTGGGNLTLGGVVRGTGALTTAGTGTLTLSGTDTFSGNITTGNGTVLAVTGAGTLGTNASYGGAIADAGNLTLGSTANQTISSGITGTGSLLKSNSGTLTLGNYSSFSGGTTINGGVLSLTVGGAQGAIDGRHAPWPRRAESDSVAL